MLGAGSLLAVQSQINGRLAHEIGSGARAGFAAAVISFGSGLVLLTVLTAAQARHRRRVGELVDALRSRRLRPIEVIGGLFGAIFVASQGLTVATIGVALFSVAFTAGQSCSALLVDHYGLSPNGHQSVSAPRVVAATFAVSAVLLASWSRLHEAFSWQVALFTVVPFLAGIGASVQQALNGRVARQVDPWVTTLNNFLVGSAALLVAFGLSLLGHGELHTPPTTWWLYAGGVLGIAFIWLAALLVHVYGVLVLSLSMIAGQVIGAELIQVTVDDTHLTGLGIAAGALTVVGVVVALAVRPHRPRSRPAPDPAVPGRS